MNRQRAFGTASNRRVCMWSRVVEIMFGCWLLMSPFIFSHTASQPELWINDLTCGAGIIVLALCSYWKPLSYAHLLSIAIAAWLIAFAYWPGFGEATPPSQNHLVIGFLLLMFAIIPNNASQPAPEWRDPPIT